MPKRARFNLKNALDEAPEPLSPQQAVFVERYCQNGFNASEAAQFAKYEPDPQTGYYNKIAYQVLHRPAVRLAVEGRIKQIVWEKELTTARLCEQASATLADFIKITSEKDKEGVEHESWVFDVVGATKAGKMHLLKSLSYTKNGVRFEIVDSQGALDKIAKAQGLYSDEKSSSELNRLVNTFEKAVGHQTTLNNRKPKKKKK